MHKILCFIGLCLLALLLHQPRVDSACVSGLVYDANGNPINNVDLDFFNAATGVKLIFAPTLDDNTDVFGSYGPICVLPGLYHISYDPPDSTHFMGTKIFNVDLRSLGISTDTVMPQIVLNLGIVISGVVTDSAGVPVVDANVNVDSLNGGRVYTSNDKSKLGTGAYWTVVPPGTYRIRYQPPPTGGRLRGVQIDSATIVRDTVINASMINGMLFSGSVTNSIGNAVQDVNVDLRIAASGQKVFVSNNRTDSIGFYQVAVPVDTYTVIYTPPVGSRYVAETKDSFVIAGDITWDQILGEGVICSVFVHDSTGSPVFNADLDLKYFSTGVKLFTPNDKSNTDGYIVTAVFPDIYEVQIQPPPGSFYNQLVIPSVTITSDKTLSLLLPEVQRINWSGQVINSAGIGFSDVKIDLQVKLTGTKAFLVNNLTDSLGYFSFAAPIGTYDALFSAPAGTRYVSQNIENVVFSANTLWQAIILQSGILFTALVYDNLGQPLLGADLDFTLESTSNNILTPYDNTDAMGLSVSAVPAGVYTIKVDPPLNSPLFSTNISGISVMSDTAVTFLLSGASQPTASNFILNPNYPNPFNSQTNIQYFLLSDDRVSLSVYNILGQRVKTLRDEFQPSGMYVTQWDGTNSRFEPVATGVYFYLFTTSTGKESHQMMLVR